LETPDIVTAALDASETPIAGTDANRAARVAIVLRLLGSLDLLALVAYFLPAIAIRALNDASGLGLFPDEPVAWYLARSASLMYAAHGALLWFLSFRVKEFAPVIRFLAACGVVHGLLICWLDFAAGLPQWWIALEGPAYAAAALALWFLVTPLCDRYGDRS
jgi:hypothetical protein